MLSKTFLSKTLNATSFLSLSAVLLGTSFINPSSAMPDETVEHICSSLTARNLALVSQVSQQWQKIAEKDILWKRHGVDSKNAYVARYGLMYKKISEVLHKRKPYIYGHATPVPVQSRKTFSPKPFRRFSDFEPLPQNTNFCYRGMEAYNHSLKIKDTEGMKKFRLAEGQRDILDSLVLSCFLRIKDSLYPNLAYTSNYMALAIDLIGEYTYAYNIAQNSTEDPLFLTLPLNTDQIETEKLIQYVYGNFSSNPKIQIAEKKKKTSLLLY